MTQIRTDLERMAEMLAQAGREPATDEDEVGDRLPALDRIVVFIDDLDRCPRTGWSRYSKPSSRCSPSLCSSWSPPSTLAGCALPHRALPELFRAANPTRASRDSSRGSTPMQYLEKTFQIPFTLPPVNYPGYITMIDALTAPVPRTDRPAPRPDGDRSGPLPPPPRQPLTLLLPSPRLRNPGCSRCPLHRWWSASTRSPSRRRAAPHRPARASAGHHPPVNQAAGEQPRAAQRTAGGQHIGNHRN
jgi:hypothetical protein